VSKNHLRKWGLTGGCCLVAVASLALSACSSSGTKAQSNSPSSPGGTGSAATGTPIKIGLAIGQTGFNADAQIPTVGVAKAWAAYTNANGGIKGHPVAISIVDSQGTPVGVQGAMTKLANDGNAAIVLNDAAGGGAATQTNVATVGVGTYDSPPFHQLANYFSVATSNEAATRGYALAASAIGVKKFGEVACAEVAVCKQSGDILDQQAKLIGLDFAGVQLASASAPSYAAQCQSQIQAGSELLALGLSSEVWKRLAPQCIQQGYKGVFGIVEGSFIQAAMNTIKGGKFSGEINSFPWWVDNPVVKRFRDAMAQYSPSTDIRGANQTGMWASLELIKAAAAKVTGAYTPASVLAAFYTLKDVTLGGLLPRPETFTPGTPQSRIFCQWFASYDAGDKDPKVVRFSQATSQSNGASGDLQSQCVEPLAGS